MGRVKIKGRPRIVYATADTEPYKQLRIETAATELPTVMNGDIVDLGGRTYRQNASMNWRGDPHGLQNVPLTCTISNGSPAVITCASHPFQIGDAVCFTTTGELPAGITARATTEPDTPVYYVITAGFAAGSFRISTSQEGSAVNTTDAGSGVHSVQFVRQPYPLRDAAGTTSALNKTVQNAIITGTNSGQVNAQLFSIHQGGYTNSAAFLGSDNVANVRARQRWMRIGGLTANDCVWDGIRIGGDNSTIYAPDVFHHTVEEVWLSNVRDDAFENDNHSSLDLDDLLVDGAYVFVSARNGAAATNDRDGDRINIDECLVRLVGFPEITTNEKTVTFTAATNLVNSTNHGFVAGDRVGFRKGNGTLPAELTPIDDDASLPTYYVLSSGLTADAFKVSLTDGGAEIDFSGAGTGTTRTASILCSTPGMVYKCWDFAAVGQPLSPRINITNSIIALDLGAVAYDTRLDFDNNLSDFTEHVLSSTNNKFLWFGTGTPTFDLPSGFTQENGATAQATWAAAKAAWIAAHPWVPRMSYD